ncbi:MAG: MOSC domain-containing protein [Acidobacteriota bacterium]|nr:MOSC domain-containing protein [Acidobacteriota bacterium]
MKISKISIYPVKSLTAIDLSSSVVTPRGLRHDRRSMIVDAAGNLLSQREHPELATLHAEADESAVVIKSNRDASTEWRLDGVEYAERRKVTVWTSQVEAVYAPEVINAWLSDYLGNPAFLVYMPEDSKRPINAKHNRGGEIVSFADGYPVLLTSSASLSELNQRMGNPVEMERFRPNLVVEGADAFAEDEWKRIKIGAVTFRITKPCARCVVTTINQKTGEKEGMEPLKSLAAFRKAGDVYPDRYEQFGLAPNDVLFGTNLVAETTRGSISNGDSLEVLK